MQRSATNTAPRTCPRAALRPLTAAPGKDNILEARERENERQERTISIREQRSRCCEGGNRENKKKKVEGEGWNRGSQKNRMTTFSGRKNRARIIFSKRVRMEKRGKEERAKLQHFRCCRGKGGQSRGPKKQEGGRVGPSKAWLEKRGKGGRTKRERAAERV